MTDDQQDQYLDKSSDPVLSHDYLADKMFENWNCSRGPTALKHTNFTIYFLVLGYDCTVIFTPSFTLLSAMGDFRHHIIVNFTYLGVELI